MTLRLLSSMETEYFANSGNIQDVQNAIDEANAAGGGTVIVPFGTFDWDTFNIMGPNNYLCSVLSYGGITLKGAGKGETIFRQTRDPPVQNTSMIAVDGRNGKKPRITGISFRGFVSTEDMGTVAVTMCGTDYRIEYCDFDSFSTSAINAENRGVENRGLVDHCDFDNSYKAQSGTWEWGYGVVVWNVDYTCWSDINTLLGKYEGAKDIMFLEDCTFSRCRHATANSQNGYYVIRHCTIKDAIPPNFGSIDTHGFNCGRGCEAYDNTVIATQGYPAAQAVWLRGGTSTVFNNTFINHAYGVNLYREDVSVPPYPHQNPVTDTYIWNNVMQGGGTVFSDMDAYTQGVDYFLYARPNYTPYPYPHPLTLEGPTTPFLGQLEEGVYVVSVPSIVTVTPDTYNFKQWNDGDTNPTKTINLTSDISLTAIYEKAIGLATLRGTVKNNKGSPIADADVSCNGVSTKTLADGSYEFKDLEPKQYTVTITKAGYQTQTLQIDATNGGTINLPEVKLSPALIAPSWLVPATIGLSLLIVGVMVITKKKGK